MLMAWIRVVAVGMVRGWVRIGDGVIKICQQMGEGYKRKGEVKDDATILV